MSRQDVSVRTIVDMTRQLLGAFGEVHFSLSLHHRSGEPDWERGSLDCRSYECRQTALANICFDRAPKDSESVTISASNESGNRIDILLPHGQRVLLHQGHCDRKSHQQMKLFGNTLWYPAARGLMENLEEYFHSVLEDMRQHADVVLVNLSDHLLLHYDGQFWTQCK